MLLLTMVKSEYYYIVGFSRPDRKIEIAFDYESELHESICERMTVDFGAEEEYVLVKCFLKNVHAVCESIPVNASGTGEFCNVDNEIVYSYRVRKDRLIPVGMEQMHEHILKAKCEIVNFLENYYACCLS